jgi:class 3 adenylate cyclase/ABC-type transport system involved in cytochrome c biogenesis ATPase subunit/tetratricopeptide (TPR) repeat protein
LGNRQDCDELKLINPVETPLSDITSWLSDIGLRKYADAFDEAEIDFAMLADLTEGDLKELDLPVGPRRKIWGAISRLGQGGDAPAPIRAETHAPSDVPTDSSADAERRHLTVMFVDLVDSTGMASGADPEDMRDVITGYQNTVAGVIARHEGFVAKFMGDGVLCYFGWPNASEDDTERAVRAGLGTISSVKKIRAPNGTPLATRIGIATGVVIVGDMIGSGATQEAAVVGETPNLAARLQGVARPDQIVVPEESLNLLGNVFALEPLGAHDLKGISDPVTAFGVIGENTRESRFEARHSSGLTPIVGREREIDLMLERWEMARSGSGQMIVVSGEAGIGKSRITRAVIDAISQVDHTRITYQCSPYHSDSAFYPTIQQLTFAAGIKTSDGPDTRLDKLEAMIGGPPETTALMAVLLGLDTDRYDVPHLTPAQQRAHTMQALAGMLVQQSKVKPVLLVFEDLHWIDPTSLELLEILLDSIVDQNILILGTARPTFDYGFGGHPVVTRFSLNRLGRDQILAIATRLAGDKTLPDQVIDIIVRRTDGVPLFVEELTKTILEGGVLTQSGDRLVLSGPLDEIAIPSTLHDSLMARLDRLQPVKELAQTAACIGREFDHRLLARISPLSDAELATSLNGLIKAELIYRRGVPPEAIYLFKHALVRDTAYESLLRPRRHAIHTRILSAMEDDPDIAPEVLAQHADAAGQSARAIDLWEVAGKAAILRPAYEEAIAHFSRAIAINARTNGTPKDDTNNKARLERALSLQLQLAPSLLAYRGYAADETAQAYEVALSLVDEIGDTPMRFPALYGLWVGRLMAGEHAKAMQIAQGVADAAEKSGASLYRMVAARLLGFSSCMLGRLSEGQKYLDHASSLFIPEENVGHEGRFGQDPGAAIKVYQAMNLACLGKSRQSEAIARQAIDDALATDHNLTIGYVHMHLGMKYLLGNQASEAVLHLAALNEIGTRHNLAQLNLYAEMMISLAESNSESPDWADIYGNCEVEYKKFNARLYLPIFRTLAGWKARGNGQAQQSQEFALQAREMLAETGEAFITAELYRLEGALALDDGNPEEAETSLKAALATAREQGAGLWQIRAATDLSRLWQAAGRGQEAVDLLQPIHDAIGDGDCPQEKQAAAKLLGELTG